MKEYSKYDVKFNLLLNLQNIFSLLIQFSQKTAEENLTVLKPTTFQANTVQLRFTKKIQAYIFFL